MIEEDALDEDDRKFFHGCLITALISIIAGVLICGALA
jgi:hypothetical protein